MVGKDESKILVAQFTIAATVHFGVLAIFPLYLAEHKNLELSTIAAIMLFASICGKLGRVFISSQIDALASRDLLVLSSLIGAAMLVALPNLENAILVCFTLVIFNLSNGANSISVRALVAKAMERDGSKLEKYSRLTISTNVASIFGPPLAFWFLHDRGRFDPFYFFSMLLILTAFYVFCFRSRIASLKPQKKLISGLKTCLTNRNFKFALIITILGYYCYAFMYAGVGLFVTFRLGIQEWAAGFLVINAIAVILVVKPLNRLLETIGVSAKSKMAAGFMLFIASFTIPTLSETSFSFLWAILLWSLGECILLPTLIAAATEGIPEENHIAALTVYSGAVGIGEGLGSATAVNFTTSTLLNGNTGFYMAIAACCLGLIYITKPSH